MHKKSIRLQEYTFAEEEHAAIQHLLETTMVVMGAKTLEFERDWGHWLESKYSTMVNSGSSANLLIAQLLKSRRGQYCLETGDEVLVPAVTWSTTLFPIIQMGLTPVLVDVKPKTFNIDIESCRAALTERTRAIFAVHLLGNPANIDELSSFCEEKKLILLEDCCESHGAQWGENKVGTFGMASSHSYMFAHHISTIEGGMVNTINVENDDVLKANRAHGWIREMSQEAREKIIKEGYSYNRFLFWDLGFNVRPTEISAVVGLVQLKKLNDYITIRNSNYDYYRQGLSSLNEFVQFQDLEDGNMAKRSNFAFGFFIRDPKRFCRLEIFKHLGNAGIEVRPLVAGNLSRHPFYDLYCEKPRVPLVVSDQIHDGGMYLPNHQNLTESDVSYVCDHVNAFFTR